jgi:hypothetical protein
MNQKTLAHMIAGFLVFVLYAVIVFVGEALLFGAYQFLRDRGYDFWQTTAIVTAFFCALALPAFGTMTFKDRR